MTKRHCIFLDGGDTAISQKTHDGVLGRKLPIMVLKWKPWLYSVLSSMSGGKRYNWRVHFVSKVRVSSSVAIPGPGAKSLSNTLSLSPSPSWQQPWDEPWLFVQNPTSGVYASHANSKNPFLVHVKLWWSLRAGQLGSISWEFTISKKRAIPLHLTLTGSRNTGLADKRNAWVWAQFLQLQKPRFTTRPARLCQWPPGELLSACPEGVLCAIFFCVHFASFV